MSRRKSSRATLRVRKSWRHRFGPRQRLNKTEKRQSLQLLVLIVVTLMVGLYLGWWAAEQEKKQETQKTPPSDSRR